VLEVEGIGGGDERPSREGTSEAIHHAAIRSHRHDLGQVVRGTGWLLVARAAQAVAGLAALAATTRSLGPRSFGDFASFLAVGTLAGGIAQAALSDAAVSSERGAEALRALTTRLRPLALGSCTAALTVAVAGLPAAAAVIATVALVVTPTVATSALAHARHSGAAGAIAAAQIGGSIATAAMAGALWAANIHEWPLFVVAFVLQPAALLTLRQPPGAATVISRGELVVAWRASRAFLTSQTAWLVIGPTPVLVLRVIRGPELAGEYAAMARVLDVLATVGPLMGTMVLPAMVQSTRARRAERERERLNILTACAGSAALATGMPFGWAAWSALYPHVAFPKVAFAIAGVGYAINTATGLPDRLLQAAGRPAAVARIALCAAVGLGPLAVLLVHWKDLAGGALATAIVLAGAGVALLVRSAPSAATGITHAAIGLVTSCAALIGILTAGNVVASSGLSAAALLAMGSIWFWSGRVRPRTDR
jgi:O-antigen/teichoic acid export membrane protein